MIHHISHFKIMLLLNPIWVDATVGYRKYLIGRIFLVESKCFQLELLSKFFKFACCLIIICFNMSKQALSES